MLRILLQLALIALCTSVTIFLWCMFNQEKGGSDLLLWVYFILATAASVINAFVIGAICSEYGSEDPDVGY